MLAFHQALSDELMLRDANSTMLSTTCRRLVIKIMYYSVLEELWT